MMMITGTITAAMMGPAQELVELGGSAVMWAIWKIMDNYVCSLESESGIRINIDHTKVWLTIGHGHYNL